MADDAPKTQLTKEERRRARWAETKMDFKWATALLFVLILSVSGWLWSSWDAAPAAEEDLAEVTDVIFATGNYSTSGSGVTPPRNDHPVVGQVVPFEILSILLLAALIAGVVIALREKEGDL